jgi:hypothetical protein
VTGRLELSLLPDAPRVGWAHQDAGPQLDHLCGPYWISVLLRSRGWDVSQEAGAASAGTLLPPAGSGPAAPPGEPERPVPTGAIDRSSDPAGSGTAIPGMLTAVSGLSGGRFAFVPIRSRGGSPLDAASLLTLIDEAADAPSDVSPVLNIRTGALWGSRASPLDAVRYLAGGDVLAPRAEWDVGHFVNVAGIARGPARAMVLLRDSYPSLGWAGHHLQPVDVVSDALRRDDGREGGCLLLVADGDVAALERRLKEADFDIGIWDNGTPYRGGTT